MQPPAVAIKAVPTTTNMENRRLLLLSRYLEGNAMSLLLFRWHERSRNAEIRTRIFALPEVPEVLHRQELIIPIEA